MPTFTRRRLPAAAAAIAIVASLAFAAPAQADEVDPTIATDVVVAPTETDIVTPTDETPADETPAEETPAEETPAEDTPAEDTPADDETSEGDPGFAALRIVEAPSFIAAAPVAPIACAPIAGWAAEDLAPIQSAAGLVFNGPKTQSVNYYQRVSAGNAQGLTGMAYTLAAGTTGFKAELKVEVNPNADLGSGVITYATLSTIGNGDTGTIDAQNGLWYTSKIAYASPGGQGNPLSWDDLIALMPNNTLLSAPSLHLQSNSTANSHSVVTSVTSSCGTTTFPETVAAQACAPIAGWATEDVAPVLTDAGLVFNGPSVQAINYYQRVSAGNAQGLTAMSYTLAPGTTGYKAELKVEVNPNADLGSGTIHYATLSTIGNPDTGTIDAQNGLWYTSKIAYASPGGQGNPLSWNALISLMPNNTLLSAPSLHLQSNSTAGSRSVVTAVSSSCGSTNFTNPAPTNTGCLTTPTAVTVDALSDLTIENRTGGSSSVTSKGLQLTWHGPDLSQSKAAWYYATDFPLSQLGTPSIAYSVTSGASVGENYTISVDGAWKGNIVKEPGIANYWTTFSIPGMSADPTASYRKAVGTIDDFLAAYWADDHGHDIRVIAVGGSGGSGSEGVGILSHQTAGCVDITYGVPAPVVEQCTPTNVQNVTISNASQLFYDSRTGGSSSVTSNGLELAWHGPDLSQSKVAWYYAVDFPLYKLGTPTITYDSTSGASVGENYMVTVDGAWKGNIVKEPGIANYWTTFSIPGMSADPTASYRKAIGTIQDFVNAYWVDDMTHDVRVVAIGGSGGSGSEGTGILHKQTAGCYALTYGIPAVVVTPPATGGTTGGTTTGGTTTTTTPGAAAATTPTSTPTPTPSATPSATPTPEATADADLPTEAFGSEATGDAAPWWPWVLGLVILLLLALLWFILFRRRRNAQP